MSERASWADVKARRGSTETRRRSYQETVAAYELGTRVREERERLALTQVALAERMGTSQPAVARLEAGGVTPSLDTLYRVAEAFGLELIIDFKQTPTYP